MGTIPRYLDMFDIDFFLIAMRYTLLEQDVLDLEFPRCAERGVGIVIGGPYNSGITATGAGPKAMYNYEPAGPEIQARVRKHRGGLRAPQRRRLPPPRCSSRSAIRSSLPSSRARSRAPRSR